ncbi:MAG: vWA domain-containing protein [Planctomycetota bacterium]
MKTSSLLLAALLFFSARADACGDYANLEQRKTIDVAICLDVSGSMSGLINSARAKLWAIVNDLALAKPTPRLRVALLTFGHSSYRAEDGWVRVDVDLTEDLDLISQKLFALTTNGGTELVGRVMQASLDKLSWTKSKSTLKLIIVAGNESADQDKTVDYRLMSKRAIESGIMVNAIYCGNPADDIAPGWKDVSLRADGHFACIDQNRGTVTIATPFDKRIAELSTAMNATYIPLGSAGKKGAANQKVQDRNAAELGMAIEAARAQSKSTALYRCTWCLVDSYLDKSVDLTKIKQEDLPEALRGKSIEELRTHIEQTHKERQAYRKQIAELNSKRAAFVAAEAKKKNLSDDQAFDKAVRAAIRAQAAQKGYAFQEAAK